MIRKYRKLHRIFLLLTFIISVLYIIWRIFYTIPTEAGAIALMAGIALAGAEMMGMIEAAGHYLNGGGNWEPELPEIPEEWYPHVDILIATHNESEELLYKTVNGCRFLKYPDKNKIHIYLCDDGNRERVRQLAKEMKVGYLGLADNREAKAGNLNHAISKTDSPFIATFDADMIPLSDFLLETVPYFYLPKLEKDTDGRWKKREQKEEGGKLGFIQTPQSFYNPDLFQYNLYSENDVPNEQDYFFREVNVGRNRTNTPIYAGSNTLISREALAAAGGIKRGSITEDFATGIEIQSRGYICYATGKPLALGLAPTSVKSLIKQRARWGRGCIHTLKGFGFLSGGLSLPGKMSYLYCLLYWWTFLRRFIYIASPILFTAFHIPVVDCTGEELFFIWLPAYLMCSLALKTTSGGLRSQRWSNMVDTIIFPYLILPMIVETLGIKQKKFAVTEKKHRPGGNSNIKYAIPHLILIVGSLWGLYNCLNNISSKHWFGSTVLAFWLVLNLYFLIMAVFFMRGRVNLRNEERMCVQIDVEIETSLGLIKGKTVDISESGMAVILDHPAYVPYDAVVSIRMSTDRYQAAVYGRAVYAAQAVDQWKYSFQITSMSETDKAEYYAIIYDRSHTFPARLQSGPLKELQRNIKGRKRCER